MIYSSGMRGWHQSDGARKHDHERSHFGRIFARYGSTLSLVGLVAAGCAAQEEGDMPGGGASGGSSSSGSSSGGSANGGSNAAGTSNASGSGGKGSVAGSGGSGMSGSGGVNEGGSGGTSGSAGASGGKGGSVGTGGAAAGAGGKGGSGGTGGNGGGGAGGGGNGGGGTGGSGGTAGTGGGGSGGMGGTPVDACMNKSKDANETDVDCGGVCATKCATGKGCNRMSDCVASDVCDSDKCRAVGCAGGTCAYALTHYIIGSGAVGQVIVSWDSDSLDLDFLIEDATPFDDSANNWEDDSVEIYLDLNKAKTTSYETDDFQITVPRNAGALSGGTGAGGNLNFNAIVVSNRMSDAKGYSLTVSIPYSALNNAGDQTGKTIGFDIAINDDTNGGTRDGQGMLYGGTENYHDTSAFGTLTLSP
ncbi:MAG TPA: sugar-binding protein [Polyangiaceae bacterium]|nr:sugar-binding protein [Polyangiaceae bacterium]